MNKVFNSIVSAPTENDPKRMVGRTLQYQKEKRPSKRGPELDAWKARRAILRREFWGREPA